MINIAYELQFPYEWFTTPAFLSRRPVVQLRLASGGNYVETLALVDSGADYSVFDAEYLQALGLQLTKGVPIAISGFGGSKGDTGYIHRVEMSILGTIWPPIAGDVIFLENVPSEVGNVVGRHGFFHALKIGFEEGKQVLYLAHV